jgi:hypothetical protein
MVRQAHHDNLDVILSQNNNELNCKSVTVLRVYHDKLDVILGLIDDE